MKSFQKVHPLRRFEWYRVYSKLKNSECQSKGSAMFHCTHLFVVLGPSLLQYMQDYQIYRYCIGKYIFKLKLDTAMFAVFITWHLLCKIFKLFVFHIEYASTYRYFSY